MPYLAPKTVVFMRRIPLSINVYINAGIVDRAAIHVSHTSVHMRDPSFIRYHLRPIKSANVVKVPYSASNLSNNGIKARIFIKAWKKPA